MFCPTVLVHKVIISISLVYTNIQCLFIDVMNRFNKVANIEENRFHYKCFKLYFYNDFSIISVISAMKTAMSITIPAICICNYIHIISTDGDPGLRIESFAVINLRGVSTNKTIIYVIYVNSLVYKAQHCAIVIHMARKSIGIAELVFENGSLAENWKRWKQTMK